MRLSFLRSKACLSNAAQPGCKRSSTSRCFHATALVGKVVVTVLKESMSTEPINHQNSDTENTVIDASSVNRTAISDQDLLSQSSFEVRHPFGSPPNHRIGDPAELASGKFLADTRLFSIYQENEHVFIPHHIKALIFDFDGTAMELHYTEGLRQEGFQVAIGRVAERYGLQLSQDEILEIHRDGEGKAELEMSRVYAAALSERAGSTICQSHVYKEWIVASDELRESKGHPTEFIIEGVPGLFAEANARGIPVRFCTNGAHDFVKPLCEKAGLSTWVDLDGSMFINRRHPEVQYKPAPDGYLALCAQLGLKPSQVVVFEDSATGALAAMRAGVHVIFQPSENRFNTVSALNRMVMEQNPQFFEERKGSVALLAENCKLRQVRFFDLQ